LGKLRPPHVLDRAARAEAPAIMSRNQRVVICGAGIAGVSAACFLSRAGVEDILLLDERPPLTLTSDRSTECYRNWWPDREVTALMNRSIDLLEQLADASANVFRMNRRGYLYVTADRGKLPLMQEQAKRVSASGAGPLRVHADNNSKYVPSKPEGYRECLDGADLLLGQEVIRHAFPYLTDAACAALHVRRAGWMSAQQLGMHLLEQARARGVKFRSAHVSGVDTPGGRVGSVRVESGERIGCDVFVNAAGPLFKQAGSFLGLDLPVHAEIHLKVAFEDHLRVMPREAPLLIWTDTQVLPWHDEERLEFESEPGLSWLNGSFPAGAHTRPEGAGESNTILMLWDYRTHVLDPVFPAPLDDQYPEIALRGLTAMLPGLGAYVGRAARPRLDGGYYLRTRENRPLIGPTPVEGAFLIGALSGFGIMSACAAGELLTAHITGGRLPDYAAAFSMARYDDAKYVDALEQWNETGEL
jgi:glycine/D-amino acid oxidase-like deaminating enzyme